MRAVLKAMLILAASHCYLLGAANSNAAASQLPGNESSGAPASQMFAASRRAVPHAMESDSARHLLGMRIENQDGQPMGTLEDFVIDLRSGQLTYAIIGSAGLLGWLKQYRILPPELLSSATAKRGVLELECGNVPWRHAPRFSYNQLGSLAKPDQQWRIYHYFHLPVDASPAIDPAGSAALFPAGHSSNRWGDLKLATDVFGKSVVNRQNELVAVLSDLLVDLKGRKPVMAVLSSSKMSPDSFAAWLPLIREGGANGLVVDVSRGALTQAVPLSEHSWFNAPEQGPRAIFRLVDHSNNPEDTKSREGHLARKF